MTAPAPSPQEQAVIDRFGIFAEERIVEEVARAMAIKLAESQGHRAPEEYFELYAPLYRDYARWAITAYRATDGGTCGDLSPSINLGGAREAGRRMCELSFGHGGAHQHDNDDGLPPTRWIATQDGGAEEAVRRVSAVAAELEGHVQHAIAECDEWDGDELARWKGRLAAYATSLNLLRAALAPQAGDGAR